MFIYDYLGPIYSTEPTYNDEGELIQEGEFITDKDGNVLHHVNSLVGHYPEAAEPFRVDPDPTTPRQLFAGVPVSQMAFFAFESKEQAEEVFGVEREDETD